MEKHLSHCGSQSVSCIDCCKDFTRSSYASHNKCMTENERYGGKDYVEKGSKGDAKQKAWLDMITACMKETNLSSSATRVWKNLESGGFENIPRKKSKFTNFLQNSMRVQDRKAIEEIWSVFEKAFQQQNKQTTAEVKKTPKKEPMKFDSARPWYEQLSSGSSGKKQKKEQSSDSSSSSDEDTKKKPVKRAVEVTKPKAPPAKKSKKESSSSSSEEEEEEKTQKKKVVKPKMKSTPKKKSSSSDSSSSSEEEEASKPEPPKKKVLKKTSPKKKASSSSESESSSDEESNKKTSVPVKTQMKTPLKKPTEKESSSSSSSSEEEAPKKVSKAKPTTKIVAKKESSSENSSSSEEEKPVAKKVETKKIVPKKIQKKESSSSEDSSSSEEEKKIPVKPKAAPKSGIKKKVESSSGSSSSSEDEKPAPKKTDQVKTPVAKKQAESSSDDSSSSEEDKPAPKKTKVQKPVSKKESSSSSGSSESDEEKPVAKKDTKLSNGTKRKAEDKISDSSSDEEPVKKVPLKNIVKPDTDKIKKPQKTNNNNFAKKEIKPLENDYRSERDQRTIFVKNLPFSSSVDDLWEVFAKSEEDVIDCRFCIDRNTGNHKGLAFIEYSDKQFAEEALLETFKVKGRIVNIMRAGLKKPEGGNANQKKGNSDERDARTLFVKELPYTAEPGEVKEFFGAIDARFLRNPDGSAKGIAFVEFNTEKEALDAYNNEEGYEMNGRWLVVDRIQPRSQMKAGNRSDSNDRPRQSDSHAKAMDTSGPKKPRFNKWAGLAPSGGELDKKNGGIADFGGKKTTFDDSD